MRNKLNAIKRCFTLLELLVSMAVFTLLMMALMQFLNSSQKLWIGVDQKNDMFENARIALDYMSRDIQCIFYENDKVPFGYYVDATEGKNRLCFAVISESIPYIRSNSTDKCYSKLVATEYFLAKTSPNNSTTPPVDSTLPANCPSLYLCRFGDRTETLGGDTTTWPARWAKLYITSVKTVDDGSGAGTAATAAYANYSDIDPSTGTENALKGIVYQLIPYVVGLNFTCYKREASGNWSIIDSTGGYEFPYAINISISVIDKNTYIKWAAIEPAVTLRPDLNSYPDIVKNNVRTFNRMVIIGDRGQ